MTPELTRSIEIFTELRWPDAAIEDLPAMPLGTKEQQRQALAGLRTGQWGSFRQLSERSYGYQSDIEADEARLGAFAIRLGVNPKRAIEVLADPRSIPDSVQAEILSQRGAEFATKFITLACVARRRAYVNSTSLYGGAAVRLLHQLDLEVPRSVEYLKDWSAFAAAALGRPAELFPEREEIEPDVIRSRFTEHAQVGVELAAPTTASFGDAFEAAIEAGWLPRDAALELAFTGLAGAQRPADRARWAAILAERLQVTEAELVAQASALVPVLAFGEGPIIDAIAGPLIASVDEATFAEVAAAALTSRTKKSTLRVLAALSTRAAPRGGDADDLIAQLATLEAGRDMAVAKAAAALLAGWGVDAATPEQSSGLRGIWLATPPVWQPPRYTPQPATVSALIAAARGLMAGEDAPRLEVDAFLDLLVRVAQVDLDGARAALRGIKRTWNGGLRYAERWVRGEIGDVDIARAELASAREYEIYRGLAAIPAMLSTPSWVDLRIDPDDVLQRLRAYQAAGLPVGASDLNLALTRLDVRLFTAEHAVAFEALPVGVALPAGELLPRPAGAYVAAYARDPFVEPNVSYDRDDKWWKAEPIVVPASLRDFPPRLGDGRWMSGHDGYLFPTWTDAVGSGFESWPESFRGALLRAGANRAAPYGGPVAVRFVGSLRQLHPRAAEDAYEAMSEAFERGILRPEVIDATFLDTADLAKLASVGLELADAGLASIVWPLLDGMIARSVAAPRMFAGTVNLAEALAELIPLALMAVADGLAPASVLDLPGLRALAARAGSSRAVVVARAAIESLPEAGASAPQERASRVPSPKVQSRQGTPPQHSVSPPSAAASARIPDPAFDELWPQGAGALPAVEDGAQLWAEWEDPKAPTKMLALDIRLPGEPGVVYRVLKNGWTYDLEYEGQCSATKRTDGTAPNRDQREQVSLAWDGQRLVALPKRAMGVLMGPLTTSMHAVVLTTLCCDGDYGLAGIHLVRSLLDSKLIGWAGMQIAIRALLDSPDVSPARMMRVLEVHPRAQAVLWPVITESLAVAARSATLPKWTNRVLDAAGVIAPNIAQAAARGWIPAQAAAFEGLDQIADRPGKLAAITKAKKLRERLAP